MKNNNRSIVVIGATGGIGSTIVEQSIVAGFSVIATGEKQSKLTKLQKQFGENLIPYRLDLTEPDTFGKFNQFVKHTAGKIEWVIQSAGFIDTRKPSLKLDIRTLRKTFLINTESVIALTYYLLPLIKNEGGTIFISSTASLRGNPQSPIYAASKGALNTFAQSLARSMIEEKRSSITICPGPTNTPMRECLAGDAKEQQSPEIIASVVTNILNRNSPYINGDIVVIRDGIEKLHSRLD